MKTHPKTHPTTGRPVCLQSGGKPPHSKAASPLVCAAAAEGESEALLCRAIPAPLVAAGVMMYMPAGRQTIRPSQKGKAVTVEVLADALGAEALERQRAALVAKGLRPYFDFNHEDREASYWPEAYYWSETPEPGIYCRGEWSDDGKSAVDGKMFRQFSPVFHVDSITASPARIVCNEKADANMGGLVNKPAFRGILPLFAKEAPEEPAELDARELRELTAHVKRITRETQRLLNA